MNTQFETKEKGNKSGKTEWLTPPEIINDLGEFDLDPCAPINPPWNTAKNSHTIEGDGLKQKWEGRVWLNPPYGRGSDKWIKKGKEHGNTMLLIFARTETRVWHKHIWNDADAIFFFKGRLKFYHVDGTQGGTAGAPSVLVAYGKNNVKALEDYKLHKGKLIYLK